MSGVEMLAVFHYQTAGQSDVSKWGWFESSMDGNVRIMMQVHGLLRSRARPSGAVVDPLLQLASPVRCRACGRRLSLFLSSRCAAAPTPSLRPVSPVFARA